MQEKKSTKPNKLEDISNLKSLMSLNDSLFEATKTAIRTKNNEIVLKMIENLSDRPDLWVEYLSLAIIWGNFLIFKHMIDKFNIDLNQNVSINAALLNCEYLSDPTNKTQKPTENKENYLQVEVPMTILAAIGGDIDIYKYLVDRSVNSYSLGHIGLSRKLKNSVISNVIGACAFYGRINLLHYILEKTASSLKLDINQKTSEKKSKTKQFSLQKEFADFSPIHLVIANDLISEDESIEVIKLLQRYKCEITMLDWNRNNILHLAVKFNKKRIVKFILEDLKLVEMNEVSNKEGQTAMAIAKSLDANDIFNYLQSFCKSSQAGNDLEEELLELIENTNNKKKKKNKKSKKKMEENLGVIGTTNEFQETLKPPKEKPVEAAKKDKEIASNIQEKSKENVEYELEEEEFSEEGPEKEKDTSQSTKKYYERKSYYTNFGDNQIKKNYKYGYNNSNAAGYRSNPNYSNRNYEKDYNDYDYNYKTYKKDSYGYNNNYNTKTYGDDKKFVNKSQNSRYKVRSSLDNDEPNTAPITTVSTTTAAVQSQSLISDNINKQPSRTTGIVGLSSKYDKKAGKAHEKEREKEILKENERKVSREDEKSFIEKENIPVSEIKSEEKQVEIPQEALYDLKEKDIKEDIINSKDENPANANVESQSSKYEVIKIEEQEHENEEDYMGEENFITDENVEEIDLKDEAENRPSIRQENQTLHNELIENPQLKEEQVTIIQTVQDVIKSTPIEPQQISKPKNSEANEKEFKELTAKFLDLQKELEKERKLNQELNYHIRNPVKPIKIDIHQVQLVNSEENISDLLYLANDELRKKSQIIFELTSRLEYLEGKDIRTLDETQLNNLKDFYSGRLGLAIDALNNLKNN